MADISKTDKNFAIKTNIDKEDIEFFNVEENPFKVYGVFKEGGIYRRMPESVAKSVSQGVHTLHVHTAGGRVRFVTDSLYVAIIAKTDKIGKMPHFAFTGSAGFDLYDGTTYISTFVPPVDVKEGEGYESVIELGTNEEREITINFPLYSNVVDLYIGVQKGSVLKKASPYKNKKPIVYYGSSITQGGCASRPGSSYQSIISRRFNYDFVNLGFSGNAKAEDEMIDYIKNLDMSLFVYDYDHNAPSPEHLLKTHEKMFKAVREKHPDMPIVMMSRPKPKVYLNDGEKERLEIIKTTYENALSKGDKNVYLIDGAKLTELCGNEGTVDNCHPTDFGFASMAKALGDVLEDICLDD